MLSTNQLLGFLREKDKTPGIKVDHKGVGIYMAMFNQIPAAAKPKLSNVDIDITKLARSAYVKNSAIVTMLETFHKVGALEKFEKRSESVYRVTIKEF